MNQKVLQSLVCLVLAGNFYSFTAEVKRAFENLFGIKTEHEDSIVVKKHLAFDLTLRQELFPGQVSAWQSATQLPISCMSVQHFPTLVEEL